jgi:ELWxxDGT repeat protein
VITGANSGINNTATGTSMIIGLGNAVYFSGNESTTSTGHLYKYDPATGVTSLVYKMNPTGSSSMTNLAAYPGRILFSASNGLIGSELWQYKGTGVPALVADIRSGALSSNPGEFCLLGNTSYFQATDSSNGTELFKMYDTTLAVKNVAFNAEVKVYPNPATSTVVFDITSQSNQSLNIILTDMTGRTIYNSGVKAYTAGNNAVTVPVAELASGMYIYSLRDENGRLMMSGKLQKQ